MARSQHDLLRLAIRARELVETIRSQDNLVRSSGKYPPEQGKAPMRSYLEAEWKELLQVVRRLADNTIRWDREEFTNMHKALESIREEYLDEAGRVLDEFVERERQDLAA